MMQTAKLNWKTFAVPRQFSGRKTEKGMAQAPSDDRELVRRLAKGDREAFGACYERYQGAIYRFAWHMTGNRSIAEEVTQEVFLRLIQNPRKHDPEKGPLGGYLAGIARNVMRRHAQSGAGDLPLEEEWAEDESAVGEGDVLADLDRAEALECLRTSMLALPASYREALVLCDLEEMSYVEAAAVLQIPAGTVASRLHRARSMLKHRLKEMGCVR